MLMYGVCVCVIYNYLQYCVVPCVIVQNRALQKSALGLSIFGSKLVYQSIGYGNFGTENASKMMAFWKIRSLKVGYKKKYENGIIENRNTCSFPIPYFISGNNRYAYFSSNLRQFSHKAWL